MEAQNIPINGTSATLPGDLYTGMLRHEKGRTYILVKNGAATLANGVVCRPTISQTTPSDPSTMDLIVVVADAITDPAVCANNTGGTIAANLYFWGIMRGRGYALGGAAIGDGLDMMHHTTDGTVGPVAGGGATSQHLGYTISDVTTDVVNAVFWDLPSKRPIA